MQEVRRSRERPELRSRLVARTWLAQQAAVFKLERLVGSEHQRADGRRRRLRLQLRKHLGEVVRFEAGGYQSGLGFFLVDIGGDGFKCDSRRFEHLAAGFALRSQEQGQEAACSMRSVHNLTIAKAVSSI